MNDRKNRILIAAAIGVAITAATVGTLVGATRGDDTSSAQPATTTIAAKPAPAAAPIAQTPASVPVPAAPAVPVKSVTAGQRSAFKSAKQSLESAPSSRAALIHELVTYDNVSVEDATYGVDAANQDWNSQAANSAIDYLVHGSFSRSGLIRQLEFEKYTTAEATYGVDRTNADWNRYAVKSAKEILYSRPASMPVSRAELINMLEVAGFTPEQAEFGVSGAGN